MAGTTGLEPATSDVTGQRNSPHVQGVASGINRLARLGRTWSDTKTRGYARFLAQPVTQSTFVHEITHLLQGTDWHSDTGVMKARWDGRDFWKMSRMEQLPFTEMDLILIHFGLEARKGLSKL